MLFLQRIGLRNAALRNLKLRDLLSEDMTPLSIGKAWEKGGVVRPFVLRDDSDLNATLERYIAQYSQTVVGWRYETSYLFPRSHSEPDVPMTASQLHYWFRQLCARVGVRGEHATIHQFRHFLVNRHIPSLRGTTEALN